ncbi:hypothetical protein PIB30_101821, partial [Stylosanthes scabra]|nr:hypothetical protein [Stylosanthes scabra]
MDDSTGSVILAHNRWTKEWQERSRSNNSLQKTLTVVLAASSHRRPSSPSFLAASSSGPVTPSDPPFNFDRRSPLRAQGTVPSEFDA